MEFVCLPDTLDKNINESLLRNERIDWKSVEQIWVKLDDGYDIALIVNSFLIFYKDIFPNPTKVNWFNDEQIIP